MDEYFVGGSLMFSATVGWKHYYLKSNTSIYSILSGHTFFTNGFGKFHPTISYSLEHDLAKRTQIKFGGFGIYIMDKKNSTFLVS